MGFLDALMGGGQQVQQPGQAFQDPMQGMGLLGRLQYMQQNNPQALMALGSGMMQGNMGAGFAAAGDQMAQQQQETKTLNFFRQQAPEYAQMVEAGMPANEAWQLYTQQRFAGGSENEYQERAAAAQQYGLEGEDAQAFILSGNLPTGRFGNAEVGLQTVWGDGPDGPGLYQPSKTGEMVPSRFPEGIKPMSPYERKSQEAAGTKAGGGRGDAVATFNSLSSKLPGLRVVIGELNDLADKATFTYTGQTRDWLARQAGVTTEGALAKTEYMSKVDNQILPMLKDTFGAQFTVSEGQWLRATLGDENKTGEEKKATLQAFIDQKVRDVQALAVEAGIEQPAPAQGGGGVVDYTDYFGGQ